MGPALESRSWKPGQAWRPLYAEKRRNDLRRIREVSALYSNSTSASTGAIRANFMTLMLPKRAFRIDNLGRRVRSRSLSQNFPNPYGSRWGEPLTQSYCSFNACWRRARPDMSFIQEHHKPRTIKLYDLYSRHVCCNAQEIHVSDSLTHERDFGRVKGKIKNKGHGKRNNRNFEP